MVYNTAAHEVRIFIAVAGTTGIQELLTRVHNGETFDSAYQHVLPERRETTPQSHTPSIKRQLSGAQLIGLNFVLWPTVAG